MRDTGLVKVNQRLISSKWKSRKEIWNVSLFSIHNCVFVQLLVCELGYYLPAHTCLNGYFYKDLLSKAKRAIKCEEVAVIQVPQYETLTIAKILEFACE